MTIQELIDKLEEIKNLPFIGPRALITNYEGYIYADTEIVTRLQSL